ncbi:hypothetical protein AA0243_0505 [Novacetimonas hansenii NRIC 0243]|nr:hypothetical protein AA0243_0505 [Novacetimonas hansenii NRIC 0243]
MRVSDQILDKTGIRGGTPFSPKIGAINRVRDENRIALSVPETACPDDKIVSMFEIAVLFKADVTSASGEHDEGSPWGGRSGDEHSQLTSIAERQVDTLCRLALLGNGGDVLAMVVTREGWCEQKCRSQQDS